MADYLVTGKKGNGKSLICVARIQQALKRGCRIATNLDLNLEHLLPLENRTARVIRLPDRPTRDDLEALGSGFDGPYDEDKFGLLVLDELATWLNARTFADKGRAGVLDWLAHSRKLHWHTYLIAQGPNQIDKQVREALVEYHVVCRRTDRLKVPFLPLRMPKAHVAFVRYGVEQHALISDRWYFRGLDLYKAYDTEQKFSESYDKGIYSLVPPGYWSVPRKSALQRFRESLFRVRPPLKPKLPDIAKLSDLPKDQAWNLARDLVATGRV